MGINDIPQSKIVRFAEVLGTTPAYLMGWVTDRTESSHTPEEPILSEGERLMLDLFRRVPEEQQELVLQMIRAALNMKG